MTGSNRSRHVRVGGITISRLRDGLIAVDWRSFDTFELLRGLGVVRVLRMARRMLRAMRDAAVRMLDRPDRGSHRAELGGLATSVLER